MALTLPNTLANGTDADATKVQENFAAVRDHVNTEVLSRDGTVAATQPIGGVTPTAPAHLTTKSYVDAQVVAARADYGDIKMTGRTTAPTGWLFCRGQAVSRVTYANLFAAVGTAFGAGDGSTTFNVPDLRARSPIGFNDGGATGEAAEINTLGVGEKQGTRATNVAAHTHVMNHDHGAALTSMDGSHAHSIPARIDPVSGSLGSLGTSNAGGTIQTRDTNAAGSHNHSFDVPNYNGNTASAGSTVINGNYHPVLSVNFLIYCGTV